MKHLDRLRIRIKNRPEYKGRKLRPEAAAMDGQEFDVMVFWPMDKDDPYPGEWALGPEHERFPSGMSWVASGDVEVLEAPTSTRSVVE